MMVIFITSWLSFSQTPTTIATFNVSSCPDAQATSVAFDSTVENVVWVEVLYDGSCSSLTVDTEGSDFDTEIGLYDAAGNLVGNNDDGGTGTLSVFDDGTNTYPIVAGTVTAGPYNSGESVTIELISLDEDCSSTIGTFTFTCPEPEPENDDVTGAINLPVGSTLCETSVLGNNGGATDSGEGDPSCGVFGYSGGDVWFKVMVPTTGDLTVETSQAIDSDIADTTMEIYSGSTGNLVSIECDDDAADGNFSLIELTGLIPGDVLLVRVWEYGDDLKGNFNICAWSPTTLGVEDNTFNGFTYYPNPVKDVLTFKSSNTIVKVEVFNVLGQRAVAMDSQNTIQNIDMSNVQAGVYFVKVSIGNQIKTLRVVNE